MTRYVVVGAGAVGATVAAELHDAGREVLLVARGRHLELLREHGLTYVRPEGTRQVRVPVAGGPDEVDLRRGDVLVLATKSQDTETALQQWAWQPVAGASSAAEDLPVLLLQNGLENARLAARRFATVLDAVVLVPSTYLTAGEVVAAAAPRVGALYVGVATGEGGGVLDLVAADLRDARFLVQVVPDVARWKAGKLVANVAYNLDALAAPGPARDTVTRALRAEAHAVLAAAGLGTADTVRDGALDLSLIRAEPIAGHERAGSSTWQSLARTGSHEADYLNGEIVLLARLAGVDAPVNRAVQARLARAAREGTPPGSLTATEIVALVPADVRARTEVLVDVAELRAELAGPHPPLLLDVRWSLGDPDGRRHHRAGHVPSAVYVDLDTELAAAPEPLAGRHPLPSAAALQHAARSWGLREGQAVVVYDDAGGLAAARAWWLLSWAGVADVRILDGALSAWRAAGLPLETGDVVPPRGDVVVRPGGLPVLTVDDAAGLAWDTDGGVLLDARAGERYRGEVEPVDPRAGHIPGAVSAPTGDNLDADGRFRPTPELVARFAAVGAQPDRTVGVYCGSGVTAAHQIAALAAAGIPAALYPGSWSAWSSDPTRPVALGPLPADQLAQEAVSP